MPSAPAVVVGLAPSSLTAVRACASAAATVKGWLAVAAVSVRVRSVASTAGVSNTWVVLPPLVAAVPVRMAVPSSVSTVLQSFSTGLPTSACATSKAMLFALAVSVSLRLALSTCAVTALSASLSTVYSSAASTFAKSFTTTLLTVSPTVTL